MDGGSRDPSAGRDKALAGREASMDGKEGWRLTGVGIRHGSVRSRATALADEGWLLLRTMAVLGILEAA